MFILPEEMHPNTQITVTSGLPHNSQIPLFPNLRKDMGLGLGHLGLQTSSTINSHQG